MRCFSKYICSFVIFILVTDKNDFKSMSNQLQVLFTIKRSQTEFILCLQREPNNCYGFENVFSETLLVFLCSAFIFRSLCSPITKSSSRKIKLKALSEVLKFVNVVSHFCPHVASSLNINRAKIISSEKILFIFVFHNQSFLGFLSRKFHRDFLIFIYLPIFEVFIWSRFQSISLNAAPFVIERMRKNVYTDFSE